jgi:hypothetical protein
MHSALDNLAHAVFLLKDPGPKKYRAPSLGPAFWAPLWGDGFEWNGRPPELGVLTVFLQSS